MGFWDGLGKGLGNLAKAGYEKMRETNDEIANEMMKMEELKNMSYEDVVRITNENTRKAFKMYDSRNRQ